MKFKQARDFIAQNGEQHMLQAGHCSSKRAKLVVRLANDAEGVEPFEHPHITSCSPAGGGGVQMMGQSNSMKPIR